MRLIYLFFVILLPTYAQYKSRVWERIPEHSVNFKVIDFLNNNRINNCFEYLEEPTYLRLKCLRDNKLTEVGIKIDDFYEQRVYFKIEKPYEYAVV
jgi:hypothetical protein